MRRQGHFISGMVAFVVTAVAVVGLNGLAGLASAEAGGGGSSPHVECAPYTNYWKLDVPSSVESNVANDAVVYGLDNLRFTYTVRSDLTVAKIVVKGGQSSTVHANSGVLQLPSNVSHITFCLDTPQDTTTTTAPPETTTTAAPRETTTTTTDPGAECPAGWGEVLPHQPAQVTVELPEPGTWTLTGYGSNENESANEGELWFVGYGTFPAPTTTALVYDLGEVTVDAPTTLTIVVRPVGRLSVCVSASAELVTDTTTTTAPPDDTPTTTAPPDDTPTTTAPPGDTTTTTAPPDDTTTTTVPPPSMDAAVAAQCDNDTPWLTYDIAATGLGDEATVRFANAEGTAEYRVPAGSGRLLWPGAVLDSAGNPVDWPGWDQDADGTWFLNPDNPYMWARRPVSITIEVGSAVAGSTPLLFTAGDIGYGPVTVEYPPGEPTCTANPSTESSVTTTTQPPQTSTTVAAPESPETLPYTGFSTVLLAGIGAVAVALGSALVGLGQRRRS